MNLNLRNWFNKEPQLEQNGIEAVEKQFKTLLNGYVEKFPEEKKNLGRSFHHAFCCIRRSEIFCSKYYYQFVMHIGHFN